MALESDLLLEQQKMRRRIILWRCISFFIFFAAIITVGFFLQTKEMRGDHLAKITIEGVIGSDVSKRIDLFEKALKDNSVKGLILYVNSPGGTVTGGEQLHEEMVRFAKQKPVAVVMGSVAASAGYMISVPAQRIFASNSTLTGSIGVIMQSPDFSVLLDKVGVNVDQFVSGPMKGQPSMVKPISPEGKKMLQGLISDMYDQFIIMVAEGRHMSYQNVQQLADGRPYTGKQALKIGLIDQIGNERNAKAWFIEKYHLKKDIKVAELKEEKKLKWTDSLMNGTVGYLFNGLLSKIVNNKTTRLDGALAIWQP